MSELHTINQSATQHENDIFTQFTLLIKRNGEKRNKSLAWATLVNDHEDHNQG